jgi:hypothetical protein
VNKRPETVMNSLLAFATLLALLALADGSIVIEVRGLTTPTIHRGL